MTTKCSIYWIIHHNNGCRELKRSRCVQMQWDTSWRQTERESKPRDEVINTKNKGGVSTETPEERSVVVSSCTEVMHVHQTSIKSFSAAACLLTFTVKPFLKAQSALTARLHHFLHHLCWNERTLPGIARKMYSQITAFTFSCFSQSSLIRLVRGPAVGPAWNSEAGCLLCVPLQTCRPGGTTGGGCFMFRMWLKDTKMN